MKRPFNRRPEPREYECIGTNRKKIRGWRRRIDELERLRARSLACDIERLQKHGTAYDYQKLYLSPFFMLVKRNPPWWFRRRCIGVLADIARAWDEQLAVLDRPYLLEVWIGDPNFMESQVVVATGSRIERYGVVVPVRDEEPQALPDRFRWPGDSLDQFEWRAAVDFGYETGEDDEEPVDVGTIWRGAFRSLRMT